jgi:hypothetical protein
MLYQLSYARVAGKSSRGANDAPTGTARDGRSSARPAIWIGHAGAGAPSYTSMNRR